jgi:hypothetical protein
MMSVNKPKICGRWRLWLLPAIAVGVFLLVFGSTTQHPADLSGEFELFARHYTDEEIRGAFSGPWVGEDKEDYVRYFYRPICIVVYSFLYDQWGHDIDSLHLVRVLSSTIRLIFFFFILYLLSNRSAGIAFVGTLLYSISFNTYDAVVVFSGWPEILFTTPYFGGLLLFISFAEGRASRTGLLLRGAGIVVLLILGLGSKENAILLTPTLAAYLLVDKCCFEIGRSPAQRVKSCLRPRYLWLFGLLVVVTAGYLVVRYLALGREYLVSYSYQTGFNPFWVAWMNLLNTFVFFPRGYTQIHNVVFNYATILAHVNFLAFVSLCLWAISMENDPRLKKTLLFSLALIAINGVIATQLIRPRFNLIADLGSFAVLTIAGRRLIKVLWSRAGIRGRAVLAVALAGLAVLYAATNISNVLQRDHSHDIFHYREPPP